MRPFVIAGCGRSGTMGIARLLNASGIRVSFEEYFSADDSRMQISYTSWLRQSRLQGEVSGLAAPYLSRLESDTLILHQTRNPLAVIRSLLGHQTFTERRYMPNVKFNFRHVAEMLDSDDPVTLAMKYWIGWNQIIKPHRDHQYRIEDIGAANPEAFKQIVEAIGAEFPGRPTEALAAYQCGVNHGPRDATITWEGIPEGELKHLAQKAALAYGYPVAELVAGTISLPVARGPSMVSFQNLPHVFRTPGTTSTKGLIRVYEGAEAWGKVGVEIGCGAGESAEVACQFLERLYCVDSWRPGYEIHEPAFDQRMAKFSNVIKIKQPSVEAAKQFTDGSLDLVYLDGDHDYESVKADILAWHCKLKIGGHLCGHDYDNTPEHEGVAQAVNELLGAPFGQYEDTSWLAPMTEERAVRLSEACAGRSP